MSNPASTSSTSTGSTASTAPAGSRSADGSAAVERSGGGALASSHGSTHIAEAVVSKIAGIAARDVHGVYRLGAGAARAMGALRERIPGASTSASQGVTVEVGERQAAIDIAVVVDYGVAIADLAAAIRRNVISALERMTGLEVVEVNIAVNDVHLPSEDSDGDADRESGDARGSSSHARVQ